MKEVQRNKKKNRKNEKKDEKAADEVLSGEVDWEVYYSKVGLNKKTWYIASQDTETTPLPKYVLGPN